MPADPELREVPEQRVWEHVIESSLDGIVAFDRALRFTIWNPGMERLTGLGRHQVLGRRAEDVFPALGEGKEREHLLEVLRGQTVLVLDRPFQVPGGRGEGFYEALYAPLRDAAGEVAGGVGVLRDITERKRAQLQLAASEARFRHLAENLSDLILQTSVEGVIQYASPASRRLLGYAPEDLAGRSAYDLLDPAEVPEEARRHQLFLDPKGPDLLTVTQRYRRRDGGAALLETTVRALRDPATGELREFVSVSRDVSERQREEAARRLAWEGERELQRLREVDAFKMQLLHTATHELNTPLTVLRLQLDLLKSASLGPLTERQRRVLGILDRNAARIAALVQDMVDVARLQSGRLVLRREPLDLAEVVGEAVESFEGAARQAGVTVAAEVPPIHLDADRGRLGQVLFNLLSNAIKFTPRGGAVRIEAAEEPGAAVVRVRDTGIGLTKDQVAQLFQPFSQVHDRAALPEGQPPGSGLGLYITKGIAEAHGGTVAVESRGPGQGTTFTVRMPRPSP